MSFFFNYTRTTELYTYLHTLSLHDALPISSPAELACMYASGVRGVRVNLETWSHNDPVVAREKLAYAVESAGRLGWHVQIYASRGLVAALYPLLLELPVELEMGRAACRERVWP